MVLCVNKLPRVRITESILSLITSRLNKSTKAPKHCPKYFSHENLKKKHNTCLSLFCIKGKLTIFCFTVLQLPIFNDKIQSTALGFILTSDIGLWIRELIWWRNRGYRTFYGYSKNWSQTFVEVYIKVYISLFAKGLVITVFFLPWCVCNNKVNNLPLINIKSLTPGQKSHAFISPRANYYYSYYWFYILDIACHCLLWCKIIKIYIQF